MLQHHYLPTLVNDRRISREATANRRRLLTRNRRADNPRQPALSLAAPTVRTTAETATPRAA